MKKFLSIVAVVALIFALGVPTFAAVPSVTYADDSISTDTTVTTESGEVLTVEISAAELTAEESETLAAAVEAVAEDASAVEVVNVDLVDEDGNVVSEEYFETNDSLKVTFVRDDNTLAVVAVLYWNEATQAWDSAEFTTAADGTITVTFTHFCTVAFVLQEVKASSGSDSNEADTNADKSNSNKSNGSATNAGKSPQTGYNTFGWVIAVSVLLLGAGCCFISARKKVEE